MLFLNTCTYTQEEREERGFDSFLLRLMNYPFYILWLLSYWSQVIGQQVDLHIRSAFNSLFPDVKEGKDIGEKRGESKGWMRSRGYTTCYKHTFLKDKTRLNVAVRKKKYIFGHCLNQKTKKSKNISSCFTKDLNSSTFSTSEIMLSVNGKHMIANTLLLTQF